MKHAETAGESGTYPSKLFCRRKDISVRTAGFDAPVNGGRTVGIKSCYKCTERAMNCHATCPRYTAEAQEHNALRAAISAAKAADVQIIEYIKQKQPKARR